MANIGIVYLIIGLIFSLIMYVAVVSKGKLTLPMQVVSTLVITLFWLPIVGSSLYVSIKRSLNE